MPITKRYVLENDFKLSFTFFDVNGGDAIWIRFLGNDNAWHNILIDGGFGRTYPNIFAPLLFSIQEAKEQVDLWIITHIDLDHIGSIIGFIQDTDIENKQQLIKSFWFNHATFPLSSTGSKIGYRQGIKLRQYLQDHDQLGLDQITTESPEHDLYGLKFKVLSPTSDKQAQADNDWITRESGGKMSNAKGDHDKTISELSGGVFEEDVDLANGSSISVLLEFNGITGLLLADSHPSDIEASLRNMKVTEENRLSADIIKVAHHGSKKNTSPNLLKLVKSPLYIFCANGVSNKHPDKETLVRILENRPNNSQQVEFFFVSDTDNVKKIFEIDGDCSSKNFTCSYMKEKEDFIQIKYLPTKINE